MLEAHKITHLHDGDSCLEVVGSFDERQKSRYLSKTVCGQEFGWFIERGRVLNDSDVLVCTDGTLIKVICAHEEVSQVESDDKHLLTRIAYHLGNRHVPLQVDEQFLRYQRDYVLRCDSFTSAFSSRVWCVFLRWGAFSWRRRKSFPRSYSWTLIVIT